ncbi:MAG TPA: hypothetical protein VMU24_13050 [Candidatus Acidoferrales bacterium]|nr:hypothetical protein [Candidatus Acidoferrales bacterium]
MSDAIAVEAVWKQEGEYGWSHPTGWTIGRYILNGVPRFMLWQGRDNRGRFDSLALAQQQHETLTKG